MKLHERYLNEKFGDIPSWLSNRLNAVKPMGKTGSINSKFANSKYGDEATPEYQKKYQKEHPAVHSLYDQLDMRGYDFSKMSAQETEPPKSKQEIKKLVDSGKLPVWLLKDESSGKTQVYIYGINDYEQAIWQSKPSILGWTSAKDLNERAVKFAILDAPLKDPDQMKERSEWGDEAAGFSGKQRNKGLAGVETSNGDIAFDKSGYNVGSIRKDLNQRADELRSKKAELRKELTQTLSGISATSDEVEDISDEVEDIIPEEEVDELEEQVNLTFSILKQAEYRAKKILFELEDLSDEELKIILENTPNKIRIVSLFARINRRFKEMKKGIAFFKETFPNREIILQSFIEDGDFVDINTGEVLFFVSSYSTINNLNYQLNEYNKYLDNFDIDEMDWD